MNLGNTGNVDVVGGADGRLGIVKNNIGHMFASQYHFRHLQMYSGGRNGRVGKLRPGSNI